MYYNITILIYIKFKGEFWYGTINYINTHTAAEESSGVCLTLCFSIWLCDIQMRLCVCVCVTISQLPQGITHTHTLEQSGGTGWSAGGLRLMKELSIRSEWQLLWASDRRKWKLSNPAGGNVCVQLFHSLPEWKGACVCVWGSAGALPCQSYQVGWLRREPWRLLVVRFRPSRWAAEPTHDHRHRPREENWTTKFNPVQSACSK